MDYATLSLAEVRTGLDAVARDVEETFGRLTARQLNWRPDEQRWSVAKCFEHLVTANHLMLRAADEALDDASPRTIWQRLPVLPGILGRILVRSQAPGGARKFKAPTLSTPSMSDVAPDILQRFIAQQRDAVTRVDALDERKAAGAIMISPFVNVITYSVLDGWRLVYAHNRRHVEQARRVTHSPGFPSS
jgi:hypothetical protein